MAHMAHPDGAVLDRRVLQEGVHNLAIVVFDALKHAFDLSKLRRIDVAHDAADLHDGEDDAASRRLLEDIKDALAQAPAMHEPRRP